MSKIAFIYPGQGSQYIGMAKDLYDNSKLAKSLFEIAEEKMKVNLSKIMFDGPIDELKQTDITQPALFIHSVILTELIKNLKPDMAAGHSLGEYSALTAAKAIEFEDAIELVHNRGKLMLQAGKDNPGTMAAIIGLEKSKLEEICHETSKQGVVQCANFNSPGQIVISGTIESVREAMVLSKESGAKIAKELVVSGAFHSPLMKTAQSELSNKIETVRFSNTEFDVYANVTAEKCSGIDETKGLLIKQVTAPVRWEETIRNMIRDGAQEFIEIGSGKVLQGLVKRINRDVKISGIDKFEDVQRFM